MKTVVVAPFSIEWSKYFSKIRSELETVFPVETTRIEHIGSTSVQGLAAKPIIDVLLGAEILAFIESKIGALSQLGYEYITKHEAELPMRRYFVRPAARNNLRVHLHAVERDSRFWSDHILFRETLRERPDLVGQYQDLKVRLAAEFPNNSAAYTAAKAPFIASVLASASSEHNAG
ncbi:GrpB family protein [Pseudomonas sp. LTJR-52]|uniref:GrpB family protein n=1 Tax=Pseudomonas sp. LTJR-52 TaxID=2479392 RepID=UPI000EFB1D48|nr:GrpB family protein [Pseudomonas sp. LTJR-52]AYN96967.1 GrpB family protein [Pseudomonas sp. LTJR-52]